VLGAFAVRGGEHAEEVAHIEGAHLGFERVKAACDDRQERGRAERVEGFAGVVRCRNEQGKVDQKRAQHNRPTRGRDLTRGSSNI